MCSYSEALQFTICKGRIGICRRIGWEELGQRWRASKKKDKNINYKYARIEGICWNQACQTREYETNSHFGDFTHSKLSLPRSPRHSTGKQIFPAGSFALCRV
jgi:hypothetical protein